MLQWSNLKVTKAWMIILIAIEVSIPESYWCVECWFALCIAINASASLTLSESKAICWVTHCSFDLFCNDKQCAISPLHLKYYSVVSHSLISPADFSSEFNTYNLVSVINGLNEMHCWVSPVCTWYFKQFALETWPSGVLWKVKRMGPGRDPRQTPEDIRCSWGRCPLIYALLVMVCQEGFKPSNNLIPYTKVVQP